jgi:hypothetical protein
MAGGSMAAILNRGQVGRRSQYASSTFVSMANAVVLRGGVPVFVGIRPDALNVDRNWLKTTRRRAPSQFLSCIMPGSRLRWRHSRLTRI